MRTNLTAMLSFGMVSCPVGIATEGKKRDIEFRNLHKKCERPVNEIKVCRDCDKSQLLEDEMVKGYQVAKDTFVIFTPQEIEAIKGERSPVITISKFVPENAITSSLIEKSYILVPKVVGSKSYGILGYTLLTSGKAGIGKARLWGKESPVSVMSVNGVLHLRILYCSDEVQSDAEVAAGLAMNFTDEEAEQANILISLMSAPLDPEDFRNGTREEFQRILEMKLNKEEILAPPPEPEPEPVMDTMAALRESVARYQAERSAA